MLYRRFALRSAAATLVAVSSLSFTTSLSAVAAPATGSGESKPSTPSNYKVPTAAEIAAKRAEANRLASTAKDQLAEVRRAQVRLTGLQADLEQAIADEAAAQEAEAAAKADQAVQEQRLKAADQVLNEQQQSVGQLAAATYRGDQMTQQEQLIGMLTNSGGENVADQLHLATLVGQLNDTEITDQRTAKVIQRDASARAQAAAAAAQAAHEQSVEAQARTQQAVAKQTDQLLLIEALQAATERKASQAAGEATKMANEKKQADAEAARRAAEAARKAEAAAKQARELAEAARTAVRATYSGNCTGGQTGGFSNGRIPLSALCPLYAAPGHYLRGDAADAFNRMSVAYAQQFGAPICITDSYRPYWLQVQLKQEKPRLAARPGTSNHGRGQAVDLCGGLEEFGTPQHDWMRANAPKFQWCDPYWARADGSKPEAWHWQYADCES